MTLKKLFFWFWSTLVIGGILGIIVGYSIEAIVGIHIFHSLTQMLLLSLSLAAVAELGFFAYLIFNWLSRGLVRNPIAYDVLIIAFTVFVMGSQVYLNVTKFSREALGIHLIIPLLIFGAGVVVAWLKVKWTNSKAFIPTIFFMVIATVLEAIPSLNSKAGEIPLAIILHNVLILLACNAWQILQLHRWVQPQKKAGH